MSFRLPAAVVLGFMLMLQAAPSRAADAPKPESLVINVPVEMKTSKVVFNMDHLAFAADQSIGLMYMKLMIRNYQTAKVPLQLIAVFHGAAGYMLLNDAAYNKFRHAEHGNPYRQQIAALQQSGVQFEECGQTARNNHWVNANLLDGVKVNTGANLRIVQLVQQGFVQLQP